MFEPSREQARRFFIDTFAKYQRGEALSALESMALEIIAAHPEYHRHLTDSDAAFARDWTPEGGETNPFLHLSLHLAVAEQLSIDQPAGIRAAFDTLRDKLGDAMAAQHEIMECLGETLWHAQHHSHGRVDVQVYYACLEKKVGRPIWVSDLP